MGQRRGPRSEQISPKFAYSIIKLLNYNVKNVMHMREIALILSRLNQVFLSNVVCQKFSIWVVCQKGNILKRKPYQV